MNVLVVEIYSHKNTKKHINLIENILYKKNYKKNK
jgi:hypothetical protein